MSNPDRFNPTRVGIVFYQHRNLHFPFHGYNEYLAKQHEKNERDFEAWKLGKFDIWKNLTVLGCIRNIFPAFSQSQITYFAMFAMEDPVHN